MFLLLHVARHLAPVRDTTSTAMTARHVTVARGARAAHPQSLGRESRRRPLQLYRLRRRLASHTYRGRDCTHTRPTPPHAPNTQRCAVGCCSCPPVVCVPGCRPPVCGDLAYLRRVACPSRRCARGMLGAARRLRPTRVPLVAHESPGRPASIHVGAVTAHPQYAPPPCWPSRRC